MLIQRLCKVNNIYTDVIILFNSAYLHLIRVKGTSGNVLQIGTIATALLSYHDVGANAVGPQFII